MPGTPRPNIKASKSRKRTYSADSKGRYRKYQRTVPQLGQKPNESNATAETQARLTLSKPVFPAVKITNLQWRGNPLHYYTAVASNNYYRLRVNSLFDPDYDNAFGNNEFLQFDKLLNATSGPYKAYQPLEWITTWEVINLDNENPVCVACAESQSDMEYDANDEMWSAPNVVRATLMPRDAGGSRKVLQYAGKYEKTTGVSGEANQVGGVGNPATAVYNFLQFRSPTVEANDLGTMTGGTGTGSRYLSLVIIPTVHMKVKLIQNSAAL